MSNPLMSLHLQATTLRFQYMPAPGRLRRFLNVVLWPVFKLQDLHRLRVTAPPRPLAPRKRSLSLSRSSSPTRAKENVFQASSTLLGKLPYEVRQMIWKECLGGMTLHLKICHRHLHGQTCGHGVPDTCWEFFGLYFPDSVMEKPAKRQLLSLLLSCRQVYSEAIEHLYTQNVFDSLFFESVLYLPRCILPQRLTAIRSLYFLWYLEAPPLIERRRKEHLHRRYDKTVWITMWQNLSMMTGLTDLGIQLYIDPIFHALWAADELELFQNTKMVTAPRKFEIYVPFETTSKESDFGQFPCKFIRTPDNSDYF